jgi:hypothetical protein
MSELEDIFNAFDRYEDAQQAYILDEVNYRIEHPTILETVIQTRNLGIASKLLKTRIKLFDKIRNFVSASQNRMTQKNSRPIESRKKAAQGKVRFNNSTKANNPNKTVKTNHRKSVML